MCIAAQALTAGVTLPLYFISHFLSVPFAPNTPLPLNPTSKARAILPAVALGYLLPSVALLFPLPSFDLDTVQLISAIWQPFPLYISAILFVLQYLGKNTNTPNEGYIRPLKRAYYASAILSAVAHVAVVTYIVTSPDAPTFAEVFLPPYWFPSLHSANDLPAYRVAARTLFQHDWFTMTLAASVFFLFSLWTLQSQRSSSVSIWTWITLLVVGVVFGPGAEVCLAAVVREEAIWSARVKAKSRD